MSWNFKRNEKNNKQIMTFIFVNLNINMVYICKLHGTPVRNLVIGTLTT